MRAMVLHLSDIHMHEDSRLEDKFQRVSVAAHQIDGEVNAILVAITGDIAFQGLQQEYSHAETLFRSLRAELIARFPEASVSIVAVPGNHDCDFTDPLTQTRDLVIQSFKRTDVPLNEHTLDICCSVQNEFFSFLSRVQTSQPSVQRSKAYYEYIIPVCDKKLVIRCFNTALSSTNPENPGQLAYPVNILDRAGDARADYVIAIFHHPYNWLTPNTKAVFMDHVERSCDLILTGHEHRTAYYKKEAFSGSATDYVEGAAFMDEKEDSGFNVILVDLDIAEEKVVECRWNNHSYNAKDVSGGWRPYRRSARVRDHELKRHVLDRLRDPGASYSHPSKTKLELADIFVPPNLEEFALKDGRNLVTADIIDSRKVLPTITERQRVIITGRERSGKSTLLKVLFQHFYNQGFVPVILLGENLRAPSIEKVDELIRKRINEDYRSGPDAAADSVDPEHVVLFIDDLDHANRLNARGRLSLLQNIAKRYKRVIVFGDDLLRFEEISSGDLGSQVLTTYSHFNIKEFGHVLRSALIDKWYDVARDYSSSAEVLQQNVLRAERFIDDLIRRSYLPSYPIFVLTMLQGMESVQPVEGVGASYGYLYQVLITDQLATSGGGVGLDRKIGYLSELAFFMFRRKQKGLSESDFVEFHAQYCKEFPPIDRQRIFEALQTSGILEFYDLEYRFKYLYFYYYFVSQYLARNIETESARECIKTLCNGLQHEEQANIWLFLAHQTRSDFLLETILAHATRFFSDVQTPKFEKDISFLQDLYNKVPELVLVNKSAEEIRRERRHALDEARESISEGPSPADEALNEFVAQIKASMRTLEVMGQIVKNFAGSMRGDPRYKLVRECYELGLRVVGKILLEWKQSGVDLVKEVLDIVIEREDVIESKLELEEMIKAYIFYFSETVALGVIQRISQAVGSKDLVDTYRRVLEENSNNAYKLVDISVRLESLGFPAGDVYALKETFEKNMFCGRLLRRLVINHFYLFNTGERVKQQACEHLGIKIQDLRGMDVRLVDQKRLRKPEDRNHT